MKQTNWNGKNVLLVELQEETVFVESNVFIKETLQPAILAFTKDPNGLFKPGIPYPIPIPDDSWQFAFAYPLSPTEEEAMEWVDALVLYEHETARKFENYGFGLPKFDNPIDSLKTRIWSEGFEQPERVVILTKQKNKVK